MKNTFLQTILIATLITVAPTATVMAATPGETIIQKIDEGMSILRDTSMQSDETIDERRNQLWNTLGPVFNFEEISKRSLGRHWLKLNPQQKKEFTEVFTTVLKDVYLRKSDHYSEGEIIYIREAVKGSRGKVQTNFVKGENKIVVDFSMKLKGQDWKIYDVTIEGVSVLTNYRTQFNSILSKSSFEELMQKLREREMEIDEE